MGYPNSLRPREVVHEAHSDVEHALCETAISVSTLESSTHTPLLPKENEEAGSQVLSEFAKSNLSGSIANLTIGVLGVGQLTLPFAVRNSGMIFGLAFLGILGYFAIFVLNMLAHCKKEVEAKDYGDVLLKTLGPKTRTTANLLLGLYAFIGAVSFMMILGEELNHVVTKGFPENSFSKNELLSIIVAVYVCPLTCFRTLDALKYTSTFGGFAAVYISAAVTYSAITSDGNTNGDPGFHACSIDGHHFHYWPNFNGITTFHAIFNVSTTFALMAFSLNSAWCFVPLLHSMRNPTKSRVQAFTFGSNSIILVNYFAIAFFGYFAFCDETKDNVVENLGGALYVTLARGMLVVQLGCALPMRFHVARNIINQNIFSKDRLGAWHPEDHRGMHLTVSVVLVGSSLLLACIATSLSLVISLASTVCASCIIYVFPSLSYLAVLRSEEKEALRGPYSHMSDMLVKCTVYIILGFGSFLLFFGTGISLAGAIQGYATAGG